MEPRRDSDESNALPSTSLSLLSQRRRTDEPEPLTRGGYWEYHKLREQPNPAISDTRSQNLRLT
ncbi:hypothetical protein D3C80_276080 [compost metagenome]